MPQKRYGLQKVEIGVIAGDGDISTAFAEIGATVSDTCLVTIDAGTETAFNVEQSDDPYYIITKAGKKSVKFSTYDTDPATLVKFFGGTVTQDDDLNDVWNAPLAAVAIELSVRLTMAKGGVWSIVRAKVNANLAGENSKTKLPQVNFEATILAPEKANIAPMTFNGKTVDGVTALTITSQPAGDTLAAGDNLFLSITVTGTNPTYQWKKGGVSIAGATFPVYGKLNVVTGDAGTYTCVVTNGKGSVTSTGAVVTVSA
jgi:hypothetical protein